MASEELKTVRELLRGVDLESLTIAERRKAAGARLPPRARPVTDAGDRPGTSAQGTGWTQVCKIVSPRVNRGRTWHVIRL